MEQIIVVLVLAVSAFIYLTAIFLSSRIQDAETALSGEHHTHAEAIIDLQYSVTEMKALLEHLKREAE